MWKYVFDLMIKSDSIAEIIKKLELVLVDLKKHVKEEDTSTDKVDCEWVLRGGEKNG